MVVRRPCPNHVWRLIPLVHEFGLFHDFFDLLNSGAGANEALQFNSITHQGLDETAFITLCVHHGCHYQFNEAEHFYGSRSIIDSDAIKKTVRRDSVLAGVKRLL